jgi:hypothetical protein
MERDAVDSKIKDRLFTIGVIIFLVVFFSIIIVVIIHNWPWSGPIVPRVENIWIKSTSETKLAHTYFATIEFVNIGFGNAHIDSVLLNGVPYNDRGWTGTVKPSVFGDITPNTWINASMPYDPNPPLHCGIIIFSDDCKDLNGNELIASGYDYYFVKVTIHTTYGKEWNTTIVIT